MKKLLYLACFLCASYALTSCEDNPQYSVTFYGTVVDSNTGNPIPVAKVSISGRYQFQQKNGDNNNVELSGASTVTGSDGTYEISVSFPAGTFETYIDISVSKDGYYDTSEMTSANPEMRGKRIQKSFTLRQR